MNKVILMGRLTRDAEVRYSQGDNSMAVARFTLAVDRRRRSNGDEQSADFVSCRAFSKTAEFLEKYGKKGTKFVLEGRIQTGSYTNNEGNKVYTTDVIADSVEFAESKSAASQESAAPQPAQAAAPAPDDGFMNIPDGDIDDLPFN